MGMKAIEWMKVMYDRVIALVIFAILIISLLYLAVKLGVDSAKQKEWQAEIDNMKPRFAQAMAVSNDEFLVAQSKLEGPFQIVHSNWTRRVIIPEDRVNCTACRLPIPYETNTCPICTAEQPDDIITVTNKFYDGDKDDMPILWEQANGLDDTDPADAVSDADSDGFTALEEFRAETDPRNPESRPPYESRIFVEKIITDPFQLLFKGHMVQPDGAMVFQINTRTGGKTYFVKMNEIVEGFKVVDYKTNLVQKTISGMSMTVDESVLTLERGDKKIPLIKGQKSEWTDYRALLEFDIEKKKFEVKKESSFELRGNKYMVITIDMDGGSVLIKRLSDSKEFVIRKVTGNDSDVRGSVGQPDTGKNP